MGGSGGCKAVATMVPMNRLDEEEAPAWYDLALMKKFVTMCASTFRVLVVSRNLKKSSGCFPESQASRARSWRLPPWLWPSGQV